MRQGSVIDQDKLAGVGFALAKMIPIPEDKKEFQELIEILSGPQYAAVVGGSITSATQVHLVEPEDHLNAGDVRAECSEAIGQRKQLELLRQRLAEERSKGRG